MIMLGVKNVREVLEWRVKKEWLRIEMTRDFGGLRVNGRYCVWSVLGRGFIREWWIGRGRSGGSILDEDTSKVFYLLFLFVYIDWLRTGMGKYYVKIKLVW